MDGNLSERERERELMESEVAAELKWGIAAG